MHGGNLRDSRGPQPVRAAPAPHAMYIHIAGGLPELWVASQGCGQPFVLLRSGTRQGCGASSHPGPGALSPLVEPGEPGQLCHGGPGHTVPCSEVWPCPWAQTQGSGPQNLLGHPSVCLLIPFPSRGRGLPQEWGRCGLASSPPTLLVPDTSTGRGLWRKGRQPGPGTGTAPTLEGRAHMSVSCFASCSPPTAGPWPGPSHMAADGTLTHRPEPLRFRLARPRLGLAGDTPT